MGRVLRRNIVAENSTACALKADKSKKIDVKTKEDSCLMISRKETHEGMKMDAWNRVTWSRVFKS